MTKRTPGPEPFNNPFGQVKLATPEKAAPPKPARAPKAKPLAEDAEAALFLEAMGEVAPVKAGKAKAGAPIPAPVRPPGEDAESLAQLAELVAEETTFELDDGSGSVRGLDPNLLRRLGAGEFPIAVRVDLHGLKSEEARVALEQAIAKAAREKQRCVLVITGRGAHSEGEVPVLKPSVPGWLSRGRLGRRVLAFCPAKPADGGAGALYVLLRRS